MRLCVERCSKELVNGHTSHPSSMLTNDTREKVVSGLGGGVYLLTKGADDGVAAV